MKLQPSSKKEILRISQGTLVCDVLLIAALYVLSLVGVGSFSLGRVLLGAVCGSAVAVGNFTVLCLTVQQAAEIENKKQMKQRFQFSYNLRLILQAVWVVFSYVIPQIHFVAGAAPVLFPNVVILYLQSRGKLVDSTPVSPAREPPEDEEPEDHLESFEV